MACPVRPCGLRVHPSIHQRVFRSIGAIHPKAAGSISHEAQSTKQAPFGKHSDGGAHLHCSIVLPCSLLIELYANPFTRGEGRLPDEADAPCPCRDLDVGIQGDGGGGGSGHVVRCSMCRRRCCCCCCCCRCCFCCDGCRRSNENVTCDFSPLSPSKDDRPSGFSSSPPSNTDIEKWPIHQGQLPPAPSGSLATATSGTASCSRCSASGACTLQRSAQTLRIPGYASTRSPSSGCSSVAPMAQS